MSPMSPKETFLRSAIARLKSDKTHYYERRGEYYIDTADLGGADLIPLRSGAFVAFLLDFAHRGDNILLRAEDAKMVTEHVWAYAQRNAQPLSSDPRACWRNGELWINPAWKNGRLIRIAGGTWELCDPPGRIFAPLPESMAMAVPLATPATAFPSIVEKGIVSFGDLHCFFCTLFATMMMPMDDVHPIIILTGEGAKGKTTTMKLLTQLVDPDRGNECMIVGEDQRNILVTCLYRKTIGLDNASRLPISDDLLSQMYAGGTVPERKLYTNNEMSSIKIERMRVLINGVAPDFSKSDFFTKTIFLEQPSVTHSEGGKELYTSLTSVETDWQRVLPEALGALLSVIAEGLPHYQRWQEARRKAGRRADAVVRFVEFAVMGEAFARAMGYAADTFTDQVAKLDEQSKEVAMSSDDCGQMLLDWLNGERGRVGSAFDAFDAEPVRTFDRADRYLISTTELYAQLRALATGRGYAVLSISWLRTLKGFSLSVNRSIKNLQNQGWVAWQVPGGENKRKWEFVKITEKQQMSSGI